MPDDGGVARVDLDILHFLYSSMMIIKVSAVINHLYELPFEFKILEPSRHIQSGFSFCMLRGLEVRLVQLLS